MLKYIYMQRSCLWHAVVPHHYITCMQTQEVAVTKHFISLPMPVPLNWSMVAWRCMGGLLFPPPLVGVALLQLPLHPQQLGLVAFLQEKRVPLTMQLQLVATISFQLAPPAPSHVYARTRVLLATERAITHATGATFSSSNLALLLASSPSRDIRAASTCKASPLSGRPGG